MAASDTEAELADFLAGFQHDPLGFVLAVFPWGEPGTELADVTGPRTWQRELLTRIGDKLRAGDKAGATEAIREAISSGHGIGKSAEVSWLILWCLSTMEDSRCTVTAETGGQLATKTWPELKKWHRLAINSHWFEYTATSLASVDPSHAKTWRADAVPWSKENSEAFAGLHNKGRRILLIFDEASKIDDGIWDVAEGALTDEDTEIIWAAFGNPTRNAGRFRECFGRAGHRWDHRQIDSREVEGTNKAQIAKWIEDYGEDSDFVRVRVRGVFPRSGVLQLIPSDAIAAAASPKRKPTYLPTDPVIVGVDVARFGDDESVIATRKGRDARSVPWRRYRGLSTMDLADRVVEHLHALEAMGAPSDAVFIDETGVGGGVIDRLRQLGYKPVGVNNGGKAGTEPDGVLVHDKAAEQWVRMRTWLGESGSELGGTIPHDDPDLVMQLEGRQYGYDGQSRLVLERKDDMAKRGLSSPDRADALALTFAQHVASGVQRRYEEAAPERRPYDPLGRVRTLGR